MSGRDNARPAAHPLGDPTGRILIGQGVLVIGATSGFGRAIARLFGKHGASVAVQFSSDRAAANAVVRSIVRGGGNAFACHADISLERDVGRLFKEVVHRLGALDIVVMTPDGNNFAAIDELSPGQRRELFDTNFVSQYLCALAAVRELGRRRVVSESPGTAKKLIIVSSSRPPHHWTGQSKYLEIEGAKLIIDSITETARMYQISVNYLVPSQIMSDNEQGLYPNPHLIAKAALCMAADVSGSVGGTTWAGPYRHMETGDGC